MTSGSPQRETTAIDRLADTYVDAIAELSPLQATFTGVPGYDDRMPDLSPDGLAAVSQLRRDTLAQLADAAPADEVDRVTVAALGERLRTEEERYESRDEAAMVNVIDTPVQNLREVFDLMPTATEADWSVIATRLAGVRATLAGFRASLVDAADAGAVSARRQLLAAAKQCDSNTGGDGFFGKFVQHARSDDGELPASLQRELESGAVDAAAAYGEFAAFLRNEFADRGREREAIGRERYPLRSRLFLGADIDIDETYEWGQQELARIVAEQAATADRIVPGATYDQARAHLDGNPDYVLHGTEALQQWMQETADAAVAALADTHFDIPDPIRRIECRIAPTQNGGIYYTGPSEDLTTRPGRMWWSVPPGVTEFGTWRERSTVYHEGVPGHHLQIAQTAYRAQTLNRWRRLWCWVSGHGEGWALYAERLMADLGFLDNPADYLGMLDGQSLRAARVVLDIGIHCELPAPAEVGGGSWDYDKAWRFLGAHSSMAEGFRRFELDRYLGWPGQAPSYKLGERLWLQLRDEVRAAEGDAFELKSFHRRALDVGSVGLDALRLGVLGSR